MKRHRTRSSVLTLTAIVGLLFAALSMVLAVPAISAQQEVCGGLDSGKIDITDSNVSETGSFGTDGSWSYDAALGTVTVTAPTGYLISGYCVKAGADNENSGGGLEGGTITPVKTYVIDHSTKDSISHFSVSLIEDTTEQGYWCSPGFWATRQTTLAGTAYDPASYLGALVPGYPQYTVGYALANPRIVKGGAFNAAADYLSGIFFDPAGTQASGENCPIDAHGNWIAD